LQNGKEKPVRSSDLRGMWKRKKKGKGSVVAGGEKTFTLALLAKKKAGLPPS